MIRLIARLLLVVGFVLAGLVAVVPAGAQDGSTSGPTLTLSETVVDPGSQITVIFTGWQGRLVTLSVCGNLAKRSSADCNMPASQGVRLYHVTDTPITAFTISTPPVACPCVIRASSDNGEVAYAPIEIRGVETGPVVDPFDGQPPLELSVSARPDPEGILGHLRSWLGGSTPYVVDIEVHNQATESFSSVQVTGAVGRDTETDLRSFSASPGELAAGQAWTGSTRVDVPSPVIGSYTWRAIASGAGPVTEASTSGRAVPWLLVVLILALVGDLVAVVVRWLGRRRVRRRQAMPSARGDEVDRTPASGSEAATDRTVRAGAPA